MQYLDELKSVAHDFQARTAKSSERIHELAERSVEELGAFRVLIHSKFDDTKDDLPDFVTTNNFSRVGIIKNVLKSYRR